MFNVYILYSQVMSAATVVNHIRPPRFVHNFYTYYEYAHEGSVSEFTTVLIGRFLLRDLMPISKKHKHYNNKNNIRQPVHDESMKYNKIHIVHLFGTT
jgi:hypothetical protein